MQQFSHLALRGTQLCETTPVEKFKKVLEKQDQTIFFSRRGTRLSDNICDNSTLNIFSFYLTDVRTVKNECWTVYLFKLAGSYFLHWMNKSILSRT